MSATTSYVRSDTRERLRNGIIAGAIAGIVSGAPSTVHALATGRGVLSATRAAGAIVGRPGFAGGAVAHAGISLGWGGVLGLTLPRGHPVAAGAAAGLAIAAIDLGLVGRGMPAIADLPFIPQLGDHLTFGVVAAVVMERLEQSRRPGMSCGLRIGL